MKTDVQTLLIMAEVNEAAGDESQADSSLTQASELQETILARSRCDASLTNYHRNREFRGNVDVIEEKSRFDRAQDTARLLGAGSPEML